MKTLVLPTIPAATRRATYRARVRRVRRGRYRAGRTLITLQSYDLPNTRVGDDAVTALHCVDCEWLDHMAGYWAGHNPRESQAYVRLRNLHWMATGHGGLS